MAVYRKIKSFAFRDYTVFGELGSGVTGNVYLAHRGEGPTLIALKLLHADADALVRDLFFNEQRLLRKANHRHVVQYIDGGSEPQHAYLATRYVEGTRLDQLLGVPMPPAAVVRLVEQAAAALDYLHLRHPDHPIIHCDVAPRNMVVDNQGNVVLLDLSSAHTRFFAPAEAASLLSPGYCAPEQLHHQPTVASDQYALAVIAFELLSGTRLYRKEKRSDAQHDPSPILARLPSTLQRTAEVLLRAQQPLPDARFPSCAAFAAQLERALRDDHQLDDVDPLVLVTHAERQLERKRRGSTRQSVMLVAAVTLAASGLLMAGRPLLPPEIQPGTSISTTWLPPTATLVPSTTAASARTAFGAELHPTATLASMIVPIETEIPTMIPTAMPTRSPTTKPFTATPRPTARPTVRPKTAVPPKQGDSPPRRAPAQTPTSPPVTGPRMPDLRGYGENQAKELLLGLGIDHSHVQVQYQSQAHLGPLFDQVPAYAVVSSLPEPGVPISSSTVIILGIRAPDNSVPAAPPSSPTLPAIQPDS